MTLFPITLLNAAALLILGICLILRPPTVISALQNFPRSRRVTMVLVVAATGWFLYHLSQLGEADYGNYRHLLVIGFLALVLGSVYLTPDFLGVRAGCVLMLLIANENLNAAYMRWEEPQRLVLVSLTYLAILLALYLAISPFRVRDFLQWLLARAGRTSALGSVFCVLGVVIASTAFFF